MTEKLIFPDALARQYFRIMLRKHVRSDGQKFEADCMQLDEPLPGKSPGIISY